MQLKPPLMGLLDPELQWVPERFRSLSLHTRQTSTPRFKLRRINGVCSAAHLQYHHIQMQLNHSVKDQQYFLPLLFGTQATARRPVDIVQCRHPDRSKLTRSSRWLPSSPQ
jgi:hypothetical protein